MNEKEMVSHIKALTKVIEKHVEYAAELNRKFMSMDRHISYLNARIAKLERFKDE